MPVLHLHNVMLELASPNNQDITHSDQVTAQLIIHHQIFLQTVTVTQNSTDSKWHLSFDCDIPSGFCSIAILRINTQKCTRMLCYLELFADEILKQVHGQDLRILELQRKATNVTEDGSTMFLTTGFSVSDSDSDYALDETNTSNFDGHVHSLNQSFIEPLNDSVYDDSTELLDLSVMYERLLLLPSTHEEKSQLLSRLGDLCYGLLESDDGYLQLAIEAYRDAVREVKQDDPERATYMADLSNVLYERYQSLEDPRDLDESISMNRESVKLTPDDDPFKAARTNNLGGSLETRFELLGRTSDLNEAIDVYQQAVQHSAEEDNLDRHVCLHNLGSLLQRRFDEFGDIQDINESIHADEQALQLCPADDPSRSSWLNSLGTALRSRFDRLGQLDDVDKSIVAIREAVELTPADYFDQVTYLNGLGMSLHSRFLRLGNIDDINESIRCKQQATTLAPEHHPDKPACLNNLGNSLRQRFERLGDMEDINESIVSIQHAIELTTDGKADKALWLNNLSIAFQTRFQRLGDAKDIDEAIVHAREAIRLTPDLNPLYLNNLANTLQYRFERFGQAPDMQESISAMRDAIHNTPDDYPDKALWLNNLGSSLVRRFERMGDRTDINEAILVCQQAIDLVPDNHPDKPKCLKTLSNSLQRRFEHKGDTNDINQAITAQQEAVRLTPDGHPDKPARLNDLGVSLRSRFDRLGGLQDLHEAIQAGHEAVQLTPDHNPNKSRHLNSLANLLHRRFLRLGSVGDINQSIQLSRQAISLVADGHSWKAAWMNNLGTSLDTRYERLGNLDDINEAILVYRQTLKLTPKDHPDRASCLQSLGTSLRNRFDRLGQSNDIKESISLNQQALQLTPDDHPAKPSRLDNLGNSFWSRYEHFNQLEDLNESVRLYQEALQLTPNEHPERAARLNSLGNALQYRFERIGNREDIDNSVLLKQEAVQFSSADHPDSAVRLNNLGNSLHVRFDRLRAKENAILAIDCYKRAAQTITANTLVKFTAASMWALVAEEVDEDCMEGYSLALSILPRLAWSGSSLPDRHFQLRNAGLVATSASAAAINAKKFSTGVEWLEQGTSVVWGQLLQLRNPLDELKMSYPELGTKLEELSLQLEGVTQLPSPQLANGSRTQPDYNQIAEERERLLEAIREKKGFKQFSLPRGIDYLVKAAELGPVVMLNADGGHCDALVVSPKVPDNVLHVPLPISLGRVTFLHDSLQNVLKGRAPTKNISTRDPDSERLGIILKTHQTGRPHSEVLEEAFHDILRQLWKDVVKPVVDALTLSTTELRRMWWCPSGPFSFLPLHAAGDHSPDAPFGSKLIDYAISSYTPSLTSLVHGLETRTSVPEPVKLLAVAQSSYNEFAPLPGAKRELNSIQKASSQIQLTSLVDSEATVERVKQEIKDTNWAHFACHGVQRADRPTESALILVGSSRLTLSEIISMRLPPKNLAFLSACQTATGDKELADEAVHLAAGMLTAGYRGVIATMWSISDACAPQVASDVYQRLFQSPRPDSMEAAAALHGAVSALKDKKVPLRDWIPFVHVGL